jgi:hypothetical protein
MKAAVARASSGDQGSFWSAAAPAAAGAGEGDVGVSVWEVVMACEFKPS